MRFVAWLSGWRSDDPLVGLEHKRVGEHVFGKHMFTPAWSSAWISGVRSSGTGRPPSATVNALPIRISPMMESRAKAATRNRSDWSLDGECGGEERQYGQQKHEVARLDREHREQLACLSRLLAGAY